MQHRPFTEIAETGLLPFCQLTFVLPMLLVQQPLAADEPTTVEYDMQVIQSGRTINHVHGFLDKARVRNEHDWGLVTIEDFWRDLNGHGPSAKQLGIDSFQLEVWRDITTQLPVRIELSDGRSPARICLDLKNWGKPIDAAKLSLTPSHATIIDFESMMKLGAARDPQSPLRK